MPDARREFSAGGVVYKGMGRGAQIALIAKRRRKVWCLPKGKIEKNESPQDAALREIKEETGFTAAIKGPLGDISYRFISPEDKARVFKKVRFFLLEYTGGSPDSRDYEVDEVRWFSAKEALKAMTYASERGIVRKAFNKLCGDRP